MEKAKNHSINYNQKKMLIEYLKKHPQLVSGKFTSTFTYKNAESQWQEISNILNSIPGGSTKNWKSWRKTWQDLRSRTKIKVSANRRHINGTGGGPYTEDPLSTVEDDIVDIIKIVSIEGHTEVAESEVQIALQPVTPVQTENFTPDNNIPVQTENLVDDNDTLQHQIRETSPSCSASDNNVTIATNRSKKTKLDMPKVQRRKLPNTLEAVKNYKTYLEEKNKEKSRYYKEKLAVLQQLATAKEKSADSKAIVAESLTQIAGLFETFCDNIIDK
ncbi:uncharacterized protein LOC116164596 [Photinus pyralis]|uniref:uncharacterized protein LOC116164596 n=1 Tax=Photinus pyralis TaxID=7054 RepID=UPI001266F93C|nr:uncharacterized protein LOC116164596 [Photinus pyralis]